MDTAARDLEVSCLGKQPYPSESAAVAARRVLIRNGLVDHPGGLDVYPCRFAEHWHLGNRNPIQKRRRRGKKRVENPKPPEMPLGAP